MEDHLLSILNYIFLNPAETTETTETTINDPMEELLTCPRCKSAYIDPRLLPCEHTLCFTCAKQIQSSKQAKDRTCPICPADKGAFPVNLKAVDLPQNLLCTALITLLPKPISNSSGPTICINCDDKTPASNWCEVCGDLCDACSKFLHSSKALKNHPVITLQEKRHATIIPKCSAHDKKETDLYCPQCKVLLCHFCEKESHSSHQCASVFNAAKGSKDTLKASLVAYTSKKENLQNTLVKKRENIKANEQRKRELLAEIARIDQVVENENKEIVIATQQFNQSENIYNNLVKIIDDKNNIDILNQKVFDETKSLVKSLYKAVYKEEAKVFAALNLDSKSFYLQCSNNNNIFEQSGHWASICGSVTSAQPFVWKFKINKSSGNCFIGLVSPNYVPSVKNGTYINESGNVGFYPNCCEFSTGQSLHSSCPGWNINDIVGLELDSGTLRFYHNDVVVKEMDFTKLDFVPAISILQSNVTLITE